MLPIIEISSLSAAYNGREVLHDVNLNIYPLDFLGIIGPNGGGKTTLVKCILGLLKPSSGKIQFRTCRNLPESQAPTGSSKTVSTESHGPVTMMTSLLSGVDRLRADAASLPDPEETTTISMGYLPQYTSIDRKFPITVEEVVLSGLSSQKGTLGRFTSDHRRKAHDMVSRMGLEGLERRPIGALSGGQLQRALLGRAVVSDPEVLILDEPSTYIDQRFEARLYELLAEINKRCAIVLVSHDIGTTLQQVKSVACVNHTLDYHPSTECVTGEWLERHFNCPIELLGHGSLPHRILSRHRHP